MTNVTIISSFTAIPDEGKVELGNLELQKVTISNLKERIQARTKIPADNQRLWWRGYLLDHEDSYVVDTCVGVNEGETFQPATGSLVLFLTTPLHHITA